MRAALPVAAFAIAVAAFAAATTTRASSSRDRRFFSARHGVGVEAPPGWTLSQHTGYPTVLVALRPSGRQPYIARRRQDDREDATALVEQSKPGLAAQGLTIDRVVPGPHSGVQLDARAARRNQALRQLYVVRSLDSGPDGKQAVVITLATPVAELPATSGPFDWVLAHLTFETPVRPERATSRTPGAERQLVASPATNVNGSSPRNRRPNAAMASAPTVSRGGRPYGTPMYFHIFFHHLTGPLSTQPRLRSAGAQ